LNAWSSNCCTISRGPDLPVIRANLITTNCPQRLRVRHLRFGRTPSCTIFRGSPLPRRRSNWWKIGLQWAIVQIFLQIGASCANPLYGVGGLLGIAQANGRCFRLRRAGTPSALGAAGPCDRRARDEMTLPAEHVHGLPLSRETLSFKRESLSRGGHQTVTCPWRGPGCM
jgi:hypothetical protein